MAETQRFKLPKAAEIYDLRPYRRAIILLAALLVGSCILIVWQWVSIHRQNERQKRTEATQKLYKELNETLLEILQLNKAYQDKIFLGSPDAEKEIRFLQSVLEVIKRDYDSIESRIAALENRAKKPIDFRLKLPGKARGALSSLAGNVSVVHGRVIDFNGRPSEAVEVVIDDAIHGITGKNGEYAIQNVPQGEHRIEVVSGGERSGKRKISVLRPVETLPDIVFPQPVKKVLFCREIRRYVTENNRVAYSLIGQGNTFEKNVGKVICFTHVKGYPRDAGIIHRWFWNGKLIAEIPLKIRSSSYRTYSQKTIGKPGLWRVEVTTADGSIVLNSGEFKVGL